MEKKLWDQDELLSLIKDESIPAIKDEKGEMSFARDYENKRVLLSFSNFQILISKNQLSEYVDYLRNSGKVEFISLFQKRNNNVYMINTYINQEMTYLVPVRFKEDGEKDSHFNDDIYYTKESYEIDQNSGKIQDDEDIDILNEMIVCSLKSNQTDDEYIPLFKTEHELRIIFPRNRYRICRISYNEAVKFAQNFSGIVYRPTKDNFIISKAIAGCFSAISEYVKKYIDYRKYTENEKTMQEKIFKIGQMQKQSKEADLYYRGVLQNIYDLENVYIILSRDEFNTETGKSVPLALTKDGEPAIYLFSDLSYAENWAEHYKYYINNNVPLIGKINSENNFDSIFSIARRLGINLCMFDEGKYTIGFNIDLFMDVNKIDDQIKLRITQEEAEKLTNKTEKLNLKFNSYDCIGLDGIVDDNLYYQIKIR